MKKLGLDGWLLIVLTVVANLSLLSGQVRAGLVYFPGDLQASSWWTLLTHPFVHVSGYHLLLDAVAFFLLYAMLRPGLGERVAVLACSVAGSVILAQLFAPDFARTGLCGLSGVGHGLMAAVSLQALTEAREDRRALALAMVSLVILAGKCLFEAATGSVLFHQLHVGDLGSPVAVCHLGGALGGALAWGACGWFRCARMLAPVKSEARA